MSETPAPAAPLPSEPTDYWHASRQPLVSLVFVLPILGVYEAGVVWLGPRAARNGVDVWLRTLLEQASFSQYFLLPTLVVGLLLAWHYTTRRPWQIPRGVLGGMWIESLLLAIGLRAILQLESLFWTGLQGPAATVAPPAVPDVSSLGSAIGFLGAGVYEELLFRLMLLSSVAWGFRKMGVAERAAPALSVLLTSLLFSAAHYVGAYGEPIVWSSAAFRFGAVFRFLAGVFFGTLFVYRGFGIAVGSHAAYNLLVKLL